MFPEFSCDRGQPSLWATLSASSIQWRNCTPEHSTPQRRVRDGVSHTQAADHPLPLAGGVAKRFQSNDEASRGLFLKFFGGSQHGREGGGWGTSPGGTEVPAAHGLWDPDSWGSATPAGGQPGLQATERSGEQLGGSGNSPGMPGSPGCHLVRRWGAP